MSPSLRNRVPTRWTWWAGAAVTAIAVALIVPSVDPTVLRRSLSVALDHPVEIAGAVAAYAAAFALRAWAWRRLLPKVSFGHALAAIHVALAGNHLLPMRLGEALRVTSLVRRTGCPLGAATATTVALRAADVATIGVVALATGPVVAWQVAGPVGAGLVLAAGAVAVAALLWLRRRGAEGSARGVYGRPDALVLLATAAAWLLEAVVIYRVAAWSGVPLEPREAVLVTAVAVAAQVAAIAPGGFGTYEAAATAALTVLGTDVGTALAIALGAHALKTAYALAAGAVSVLVPAPTLFGRLRLPPAPSATTPDEVGLDGPVLLFLPAHDEEDTVGAVVARVPDEVCGRAVEVLVVDDGSTDATAGRARAAGAHVESFPDNRGLGAAVRRGLELAVERGAAAVAFCDADGEYAPEELERLITPILAGDADYVVGSRFGGDIERMLPHRRFGNVVLTVLLRFVARTPISDGQSGYRALSAAAARSAEVIHDFNYAQVLTLDLLGKGFRYREVPISYRFREHGSSFVRLGCYLRNVVPGVWRELNREVSRGSALG